MMSLKAFHVCFIVLSILLTVGLGFWGLRDYGHSKNLANLSLGMGAWAVGAALTAYLFWFLFKMRKMSSP